MNFIPEQPKQIFDVPYFDDVTEADGWRGHTTQKSLDALKSEISEAVSRLGGTVTSFQKGTFQIGEHIRDGYQLRYYIVTPNSETVEGRIDVASLPCRDTYRARQSLNKRKEQALKMALFNVRDAIDGLRRLQALSPGYAALMPFMLARDGKNTISQLWMETINYGNSLTSGEEEESVVKGEFREV